MAVPPYIECKGVRIPAAKAVNGIYEFRGVNNGRASYRQTGVSSGNFLWYAEEALEGPHWVITTKMVEPGRAPEHVIARSNSLARWPWEIDVWQVCSKVGMFKSAPTMCFEIVVPLAELLVQMSAPGGSGEVVVERYRGAGSIAGRPSFRKVGGPDCVRLFFMPNKRQWMIATVNESGGGILTQHARSVPDADVTWSSLWPWAIEAGNWEAPSNVTSGLDDGDAVWFLDKNIQVRLSSPHVRVSGSLLFNGIYEAKGMAHGRVFYVQVHEDARLEVAGPQCLWFAEERAQWVITGPHQLGNANVVRARIQSRAWWPWEATLGGCTSPAALGSAPFAAAPVWMGGAAMLASSCSPWEELVEVDGKLQESKTMKVEAIFERELSFKAHENSRHPFLGEYKCAGLLSSRPFFIQIQAPGKRQRSALWYAEEVNMWVITADFRILDCMAADARCNDTCWFPWESSSRWEVTDGAAGFCTDPTLHIEARHVAAGDEEDFGIALPAGLDDVDDASVADSVVESAHEEDPAAGYPADDESPPIVDAVEDA